MAAASAAARLLRLRHGVSVCVKAHVGLTLVSLGYGAFGHKLMGSSSNQSLLQDETKESFDASHYQYVTEFVQTLYSGCGLHHDYCQLDEDVTFEDPAAICHSRKEVQEAFRALTKMRPDSLSPPRCVDVEPLGASIAVNYALHQQYLGGLLTVRSLLIAHIQLQTVHNKGFPESQFLVTKLEEQWNGVPPISNYVFWVPRRLNGWISYQLTSRLI